MNATCVAHCGSSKIFSLVDQVVQVPASDLIPDFDPVLVKEHQPLLSSGFMEAGTSLLNLSFRSWVVKTPRHTVLVDSCIGNDKDRPSMPPFHRLSSDYLQQLGRIGLTPEDIDIVCCTHLHADHCGWNTRLLNGRWVPTFPKARYIFSRKELDYWTAQIPGSMGPHEGVYQDSVLPVLEAGLAEVIDGQWDINENLKIRPAPGHTAGHYAVQLTDGSSGAMFCGDVVHHPVQIFVPEWNSGFCKLPDLARQTRLALLEKVASDGSLLFPAHFAESGFGKVEHRDKNFSFSPSA